MATKYILNKEIIYGVSAVDEKGGVLCSISVVGKTKKEISKFIDLCNSERLEPIHLKDAITDILYG